MELGVITQFCSLVFRDTCMFNIYIWCNKPRISGLTVALIQ